MVLDYNPRLWPNERGQPAHQTREVFDMSEDIDKSDKVGMPIPADVILGLREIEINLIDVMALSCSLLSCIRGFNPVTDCPSTRERIKERAIITTYVKYLEAM